VGTGSSNDFNATLMQVFRRDALRRLEYC
jgi:hypothetical protein